MKPLFKPTIDPKPRALRMRWMLLGMLALLIVSVFALDAPGMWLRSFAEKALRAHDARRALKWIDRALDYSPNDQNTLLLATRAYLQLNRNAAAQTALDRAMLVAGPQDVAMLAHQQMIAAQLGDMQAVDRLLHWNLPYALPSEAYESILRCALQHGKFDLAELILNQLEQLGADPGLVAYQRGRIHEVAEKYPQAAAEYVAAFEQQPGMSRAAFHAGLCFYEVRDFESASEMFRGAARGDYREVANVELASSMWEQNLLPAAEQAIAEAIDSDPRDLQADYLELDHYVDEDRAALVAARIQDASGNSDRAIEYLYRMLAFNHRSFEARALLIKNLQATQRLDEAEKIVELQREMIANRERCKTLLLALETSPQDIQKRCELAELYWYTESIAQARLAIHEILELDPKCERALALLAKINAESQH